MVRVKVCGITRLQDAQAAVELGADALGLVFYPKSPRFIDPEQAATIVAALPPFVGVVGLFVNHPPAEIGRIARRCSLSVVQLHGDESPADCQAIAEQTNNPLRVIKAVRVATRADLDAVDRFPVTGILLDAKVAHAYGGSGERFDWSLLDDWRPRAPLILAGGLNAENVTAAVQRVRPYAVDVSSGVESVPGIKDPERLRRFMQGVHAGGG
ncbi:MAG: phosphoribosylanthranilate isomerase [Magnetococcales bacterium]|nr:phosphoribosylanthranilate isomerase [Magnetococcales bacterium]